MVAVAGRIPDNRNPEATGRLDIAGAALASTGLAALTYLLIEAPLRGLGSLVMLAVLVAAVICLAAFVAVERRATQPVLPLDMFASTQFTVANLLTLTAATAIRSDVLTRRQAMATR